MAPETKLSTLAVNTKADAFSMLLDGGWLDLYTAPKPAHADDPITTQVHLARLQFGTPAFDPAVDGVITAQAIAPDSSALATGLATWGRCRRADEEPVMDGTAGVADDNPNILVNDPNIVMGTEVSAVTGTFVYAESKG